MKVVLIFVIVLTFANCKPNIKSDNRPIEVQLNIIKKLESSNFRETESDYYSIIINLKNNTDSTIRFWVMSCSWQESFIFNADMHLYHEGCDSNYPELLEIKNRDKVSFNGIVQVNKPTTKVKRNSFNLGFIFIQENEIENTRFFIDVLTEKLNNNNIIWSKDYRL